MSLRPASYVANSAPRVAVGTPTTPLSSARIAANATKAAQAQEVYVPTKRPEPDEATALMSLVERRGIWETWKVEPNLARLREGLREGETLLEAVQAYEIMFTVEHKNTVDPSPRALKAYEMVEASLRPGESRLQAAQAYADLWMFERVHRDLDPTSWCHKDWPLIDAQLPPTGNRQEAVRLFAQGPEAFAAAMTAERTRVAERDAEVRRMTEAVAAPPGEVHVEADWILVGGISLPRRAE